MSLKTPSQYLSSLLLVPNVIRQNKDQIEIILAKLFYEPLSLIFLTVYFSLTASCIVNCNDCVKYPERKF